MKMNELKTGDKVAIVNRRGSNRVRTYGGEPFVSAVYWNAEIVETDVVYRPAGSGYYFDERGVTVRLLTNCRHGYADEYRPFPFGCADKLDVAGKGDTITIPARLIVNTRAANERLFRESGPLLGHDRLSVGSN